MKRKFYDTPLEICKELYGDRREFKREISFIAKLLGISESRVEVDGEHPCGDVIFIDGVYNGYCDNDFYNFMIHGIDEYGDYKDWLIKFQENY